MIDADQFPAAVPVFPLDAGKLLQSLQFAVGQAQTGLIGGQAAVNVNSFKAAEIIGQPMLLAFLQNIRQVEIISVKMDKMGIF